MKVEMIGNSLVKVVDGLEIHVITAKKDYKDEYSWFSSLYHRSGRKSFATPQLALQAGAKSLGIKIK